MRKSAIIILLTLCTLSFNACAQWYLFPGQNRKQNEKQSTSQAASETQKTEEGTSADDGQAAAQEMPPQTVSDEFVLEELGVVNVAMILPLQAGGKPSANFFDMYSGALLAVRDAGERGMKINLNVYDSADRNTRTDRDVLESNDLIIGPVSYDELEKVLAICPEDKRIVSPLEPKAASLTDSLNLIQAPAPWTCQYDELVEWASRGLRFNERLLVIKDDKGLGEQSEYLMSLLEKKGTQKRIVGAPTETVLGETGTTRCIIVSDRDEFIASTIRALNALASSGKGDVVLYGTSRTRSAAQDIKLLHSLEAHVTSAYFIDYENEKVKDFILGYRALFNDEPGSFAYQGYDTMHYFLNMCGIYGRQWYKKLPDYSESGLQADFKFQENGSTGDINSAVRRIVFNKDLSTTLQ